MAVTSEQNQALELARDARRRRTSLDGAGQAIVAAFGLDPETARRLQLEEVGRRRRQESQQKELTNG